MKRTLLALGCALVLGVGSAQAQAVIPKPASMVLTLDASGKPAKPFRLKWGQTVGGETRFAEQFQTLRHALAPASGIWLKVSEKAPTFRFDFDASLPAEGYALSVSEKGVVFRASTPAGAFYAIQTLRQLLPPAIFHAAPVRADWAIPAVEITDAPRYAWRGVMLDPSRNFISVEEIKHEIDVMSAHKLNVLHWHLADDQGWRIEIKRYPRLAEVGGARPETPRPFNRAQMDGEAQSARYYTQEQIREVVAYAASRFVTVVPEIEMPGHATAALRAYPELSCTGKPELAPKWGILNEVFCAGNPKTYEVLEGVLDEVIALFPSPYIHVGGDEARKTRWNACPKCQARREELKCKNMSQLQTRFTEHFARYLAKQGRNLIGWDEILDGGLPEGAAIMSWRGTKGGINAAKAGHKVVMTPKPFCYIDYSQLVPNDPYEYIPNNTPNPIWKTYQLDPDTGLPDTAKPFILGLQGNLWSEYIRAPEDLQWKAWPRACALAEIAWTPQASRDWSDFASRYRASGAERLRLMGINAAPLTEPTAKK